MFSRSLFLLVVAIVITSGHVAVQADEEPTPAEQQKKRWMAVYSSDAAKYQMFRRDGDDVEELKLAPAPILTFTNPVRERQQHGAAFVWTHAGRPEVVGAIWSVISPDDPTKRHVSHELHSVSFAPVFSKHEPRTGRRGLVPNWTSNGPGIERKTIPGARPPVQAERLRLTQMRRLAERFRVNIPPGTIDGQGSLRLLSQPLYRYRSERHGIIDGALFAFVMGTDPELILMIEAVDVGGRQEWQFSAAQFTNLPLTMDYQGEEIWKCEPAKPYVGDGRHFMYWGVSLRDKVLE